ncbi:MAG: hypothetical protein A2161_02170 [Candidatus Schekmanbacteria bacterium RBG_13_48_7]|uniref:Photosynthesis system II assembly factor Ycf48/Hcf136-like domain-containing protein n=1 Tax=Candidatus Schekmanbacteria bacterium RBG_13_48_7 TaxID=1817878 RepID=A0A1F7RUW0_9BACT|nr:MAG: hypothetical protein A2161_02170 [Candidatus Schekmanbacteria bacterium RBG_13_48_7]
MKFFLRMVAGSFLIILGIVLSYLLVFKSTDVISKLSFWTGEMKHRADNQTKGNINPAEPHIPPPVANPPVQQTTLAFRCMHFFDLDNGIIMGTKNMAGFMLTTKDGGKSWEESAIADYIEIYAVSFPDKTTGYAVGITGSDTRFSFLKSMNSGKTWEIQFIEDEKREAMYAVYFADEKNGWIAGRLELIFATNDGGKTWKKQHMGTERNIRGLYFVNEKTGWAVGDAGIILKTDDGGLNWMQQKSDAVLSLSAIKMLDKNYGVCVGLGNTYLWTHDGGVNWHLDRTPWVRHLQSVSIIDKEHAWVAAHVGGIIKLTDSFRNFVFIPTNTTSNLQTCFFVDQNNGWAAGEDGTVIHSSNGGNNWAIQWPK